MGGVSGSAKLMDEPDIKLGGLSIWIPSPENSNDNWLYTVAQVEAHNAWVKVEGSFLQTLDIKSFLVQLRSLYERLQGTAKLVPLEPELNVEVNALSLGHICLKIKMTPSPQTQYHEFEFDLDQSHLPAAIQDLERLTAQFPVGS